MLSIGYSEVRFSSNIVIRSLEVNDKNLFVYVISKAYGFQGQDDVLGMIFDINSAQSNIKVVG